MEYELDLTTESNSSENILKTKAYFLGNGFSIVDETDRLISFKRGSSVGNMFAFNPLKWKSLITIQFSEHKVFADFEIDTSHQITTKKEIQTWDSFVNNFQMTMEHEKFLADESKTDGQNAKKGNLILFGKMFVVALLVAIPGAFLAAYLEKDFIFSISIYLGIGLGFLITIGRGNGDIKKES